MSKWLGPDLWPSACSGGIEQGGVFYYCSFLLKPHCVLWRVGQESWGVLSNSIGGRGRGIGKNCLQPSSSKETPSDPNYICKQFWYLQFLLFVMWEIAFLLASTRLNVCSSKLQTYLVRSTCTILISRRRQQFPFVEVADHWQNCWSTRSLKIQKCRELLKISSLIQTVSMI